MDDVKGGNPGLILIEWRTNVYIDLYQVPGKQLFKNTSNLFT